MASGSYIPPPVLEVTIPKSDGGSRKLGIPTVSDRIAQKVVKNRIEPRLEEIFHPDSYGYRPRKSAHHALAVTRRRCWQYDWVIDLDIKGFFDNIDQDLLMRAVAHHVDEKWMRCYIERWIKAPLQKQDTGEHIERTMGTPQGGVISPLLANLFLHYVFDRWMKNHHQLHPEKTKIVYCKDDSRHAEYKQAGFTFLSYEFRSRGSRNQRTGKLFTGFLPAISRSSIIGLREEIRSWNWQSQTHLEMEDLAKKVNAKIRGWINYYGEFYGSHFGKQVLSYINDRLVIWVCRKYKRLKRSKRKARKWLQQVYLREPSLWAQWSHGVGMYG